MPYNPGHEPEMMMNMEEMKQKLYEYLDEICTYLSANAHWNLKAANGSRRIAVRGFGRWHDNEAKCDFHELEHLEKIVGDKLGYTPKVNMEMVSKAEMYEMRDMNAFQNHFKLWMDAQKELSECLTHAIKKARYVDMQIYDKLCCLASKTQNEKMRVKMAYDSLAFAGWNPHDISVKSKWIHDYFENKHKDGEDINFNLG